MKNKQSRTLINDYTTGGITRAMIGFAVPIFLANLLQVVYNVVDMVVVGRVVGEAGLPGISVAVTC